MPSVQSQLSDGGCPLTVQRYNSAAAEASAALRTTGGSLIMLHGYSTAAQFIQLHDAAALPADAAIAFDSFAVEADKNFSIAIPICGIPFLNGLFVCNSSTQGAKTIGGATCWFYAETK